MTCIIFVIAAFSFAAFVWWLAHKPRPWRG